MRCNDTVVAVVASAYRSGRGCAASALGRRTAPRRAARRAARVIRSARARRTREIERAVAPVAVERDARAGEIRVRPAAGRRRDDGDAHRPPLTTCSRRRPRRPRPAAADRAARRTACPARGRRRCLRCAASNRNRSRVTAWPTLITSSSGPADDSISCTRAGDVGGQHDVEVARSAGVRVIVVQPRRALRRDGAAKHEPVALQILRVVAQEQHARRRRRDQRRCTR